MKSIINLVRKYSAGQRVLYAVCMGLGLLIQATIAYSAHRLFLMLSADWIIILKEGRAMGQETHISLIEQCPYYKHLVESQLAC